MTTRFARSRSALAIALTAAALASLGLMGAARSRLAARPATKPALEQAPLPREAPIAGFTRNQADQVEGYVSSYLCVRVHSGIAPVQLPDGSWAFARAAAAAAAADAEGDGHIAFAADEAAALDAMRRHRATHVERIYSRFTFKRPDLAQKHGLDRSYLVHIAPDADVRALLVDLLPLHGAANVALFEHVQLDTIGTLASVPNDPAFGQQWNMHNTGQQVPTGGTAGTPDADIDAPEAWDLHTGSASTIIAILDTGVQHAYTFPGKSPPPPTVDHPDLAGKVISGWNTRDETGNTTDEHGHGTHCAGNAAARGNDGIGIAGVNWNAQILAVRVTSGGLSPGWNQTDLAEGVIFATDNGAHALSMSLQSTSPPLAALTSALAYARENGTLSIAAAGNGYPAGTIALPANQPNCMAIGATNHFDTRYIQSNTGAELDVAAPGQSVFSCRITSTWTYDSGTSMASPHVAGLAGLLRSYNHTLTVAQVEQIIKDTAEDKGTPGWDSQYGWGRINLRLALEAATPCAGDTNFSGTVDVDDLINVILAWGDCPPQPNVCSADVAPMPGGSGAVDVDDLIAVILNWGGCP